MSALFHPYLCGRIAAEWLITMEDTQIVELYLQRDEDAIAHTQTKYGTRLRQVSNTIVQDAQTAEECENDTYLQAWDTIPPHEPRTYLYPFLARITRHISIDRCRHRERLRRSAYVQELSGELQCCIPGPEDVERRMEAIALGQTISAFLRSQPEQMRNIFIRRYWYMDSITDIARRFGMTQSKIKSMLFRARNALRDYLEKEGYTL